MSPEEFKLIVESNLSKFFSPAINFEKLGGRQQCTFRINGKWIVKGYFDGNGNNVSSNQIIKLTNVLQNVRYSLNKIGITIPFIRDEHRQLPFVFYEEVPGKPAGEFTDVMIKEFLTVLDIIHTPVSGQRITDESKNASHFLNETKKACQVFCESEVNKQYLDIGIKCKTFLDTLTLKELVPDVLVPVHKDLATSNVLWNNKKMTGIIDWDDYSLADDPAQDYATLLRVIGCKEFIQHINIMPLPENEKPEGLLLRSKLYGLRAGLMTGKGDLRMIGNCLE